MNGADKGFINSGTRLMQSVMIAEHFNYMTIAPGSMNLQAGQLCNVRVQVRDSC